MRYNVTGLDHVRLTNLEIYQTDKDLIEYANAQIKFENEVLGGISFSDGKMYVGTVLPKYLYKHNGINLHRKEEVKMAFDLVEASLGEMGIYTKINEAGVRNLEVNMNLELNGDEMQSFMELMYLARTSSKKGLFREDKTLMVTGARARDVKILDYKREIESLTFLDNQKNKIKIYNKALQLLETQNVLLEKGACRIEVVFNGKTLDRLLGTNKVVDITENLEKIYGAYKKVIIKNCFGVIDAYLEDVNTELKQLIYDGYSPKKLLNYGYVREHLHDVEMLKRAYTEYYRETGMRNTASRDVKRAIKNETVSTRSLCTLEKIKNNF